MDPKHMKSVVVAMTTPTSPEADAAFNEWMDDVHGPDLTETPGLYAWTRYENVDPAAAPRYLHVYELDRDAAGAAFDDLMAIAAKKRGEGRGMPEGIAEALHLGGHGLVFSLGEQTSIEVEGMQVMLAGIPDEHDDWYNGWYNEHHLPAILEAPGFTNGYRFKHAKSMYTPANYFHAFLFDTKDYAALSAGLKQTMASKERRHQPRQGHRHHGRRLQTQRPPPPRPRRLALGFRGFNLWEGRRSAQLPKSCGS